MSTDVEVLTSIKEIRPSGDRFYRVEYSDGGHKMLEHCDLPEEIDTESPEISSDSQLECPLCRSPLTEFYVFLWKSNKEKGKVVMLDRTQVKERIVRYECGGCERYRTFEWEHLSGSMLTVPYYSQGEYIVRYRKDMEMQTSFAINDREGTALITFDGGQGGYSFYLIAKGEEVATWRLDELANQPWVCKIIYDALGSHEVEQVNGMYVASNWSLERSEK